MKKGIVLLMILGVVCCAWAIEAKTPKATIVFTKMEASPAISDGEQILMKIGFSISGNASCEIRDVGYSIEKDGSLKSLSGSFWLESQDKKILAGPFNAFFPTALDTGSFRLQPTKNFMYVMGDLAPTSSHLTLKLDLTSPTCDIKGSPIILTL